MSSVFAFVAAACAVASVHAAGMTQVSFQPHSYNDIREWPQLLAKGARMIKVDPNWQNATFCATQVNANHSDPRGCFIMNHDDPMPGVWRSDYNTTDNIFAALSSAWAKPYLTTGTVYSRFYIALCFKNTPGGGCDGSQDANNWLSMVDDLFHAVVENGLNLEFVLDGDAAPAGCFLQRWRPWNSTYIDSPTGAFDSNNATLGYDRYQVLNPIDIEFGLVADLGYGKFTESRYPYQVWEPSDQPTIDSILQTYVASKSSHELRFAINIDPVQFQVYAGAITGSAWNQPVDTNVYLATPFVTVVPDMLLPQGGTNNVIVTVSSDISNGNWATYSVNTFDEYLGPVASASATQPLPPPGTFPLAYPSSASSFVLANGTAVVAVTGEFTSGPDAGSLIIAFYGINATSYQLYYVGARRFTDGTGLSLFMTPGAASVVDAATCEGGAMSMNTPPKTWDTACIVAAGPPPKGSAVFVGLFQSSGVLLSNTTLIQASITTASSVSVAAVVNANGAMGPGLSVAGVLELGGTPVPEMIDTINFCFSVIPTGNSGCLSCTSQQYFCGGPMTPRKPHPGNGASVSLVHVSSVTYILRVFGDGYCPNSETHNKQASSGVCDNPMNSTANVLNYQFARYNDWLLEYEEPTACSHRVLFGAFSQGTGVPSGTLYGLNVATGGLGVAVVSTALPDGTADLGMCGSPITGTGTMLYGWPLPVLSLPPH